MLKYWKEIAVSSAIQFGLKPATTLALLMLTGLSGVAANALLIAFMVPTASSGYILARQLGGNTEAMAAIITVQSVLAAVVLPILGVMLLQ